MKKKKKKKKTSKQNFSFSRNKEKEITLGKWRSLSPLIYGFCDIYIVLILVELDVAAYSSVMTLFKISMGRWGLWAKTSKWKNQNLLIY